MMDADVSVGSSRRSLLIGSLAAGAIPAMGPGMPAAQAAEKQSLGLFEGINRFKNPSAMTVIEKLHVPYFTGPSTAKKGESVALAVSIGVEVHPMTMNHWIERFRVFDIKHMPIADVTFARVGGSAGLRISYTGGSDDDADRPVLLQYPPHLGGALHHHRRVARVGRMQSASFARRRRPSSNTCAGHS